MSSKIKKAEEFVYAAVKAGELQIHQNGEIWRVAKRIGGRVGVRSVPCNPTRATRRCDSAWLHFNGRIPDGLTVNHRNGIKHDNRPENLELATDSEQQLHAIHVLRKGRAANQNGTRNHAAKLTTEQVEEIRAARARGEKLTVIAKRYGVTFQHVSVVARGLSRSAG